jgi:uncharacterized repeat protein (TIGR03803 family)
MRGFTRVVASDFVFVLALALYTPLAASAQTFEPLGSFAGCGPANNCAASDDGAHPLGALVLAPDGNLYGTTNGEGTDGFGTIFRVTPAGVRTVVYNFSAPGGPVACRPIGKLTVGADGALYGVTTRCAASGGTIYRFSGSTIEVLHRFDPALSRDPSGGMALGADGALYGPTVGTSGPIAPPLGELFRWDGSYSVLPPPPLGPLELPPLAVSDLTLGADGHVYVPASGGGFSPLPGLGVVHPCAGGGCGGVYRIVDGAVERVVDWYSNGLGAHSAGAILQHSDGGLYGRVYGTGALGGGVYRLAADDTVALVTTGSRVGGNLAEGFHGAIFGPGTDETGSLAIVRLDADRSVTTVHTFDSLARTVSGLTRGADGHFYGTTSYGGDANVGTLFRLRMPTTVDVVANGRQGPVTVSNADALKVSFAFHEGTTGVAEQAELYVALIAPWGGVYWMDGSGRFSTSVNRVYAGALPSFDALPFVSLATAAGLPSGNYYWVMIVDADTNGQPNGHYVDYVKTIKK